MNREVIQDFLNLPGIVGVALTNRRMRSYFYGLDTYLDVRQQEALGQGILQVVENISEGFESCEFYYAANVVFIYKLTHGLVLLVLTGKDLDRKEYRHVITQIKRDVESDPYNTVTTLKLVLGSPTQPSLPVRESTTAKSQRLEAVNQPQNVETSPPVTTTASVARSNSYNESISSNSTTFTCNLDEVLTAINKLSQFTTQYLGKVVVCNYWKSCKPDSTWLEDFEVDRNAQISHPNRTSTPCSAEQLEQLQAWAQAYIRRCRLVMRNFDSMIVQDCLDSHQLEMLQIKLPSN